VQIRVTQSGSHCVKEGQAVDSLTDLQRVLERTSRLMKMPSHKMQKTHSAIHRGNAVRMACRLGYMDRLRATGDGFDEFTTLGQG